MEAYAKALSFAIPGFILLIIIESIVSRMMGKRVNHPMDTISSLSSGVTNTLKNLVGLSVVIISYEWMVAHLAVFTIQSSVALYLLAFVGLDFAGYWSHRFNHKVNLFWNRHIIHHSSEEFNLACALRQSVSAIVGIYFFLYIPLAIIGIPAEIVAVIAPIHFFSQFWYHTQLIDKMGFLEHIIVTPSHHRVHHAINEEYLDKNFSEIFIVWDKWFGTFQEELAEVPPVYGVKKPVKTWNPFLINFMHLWLLIKDAWRTRSWRDKLRLWFMPTGWRPTDVQQKYPVEVTTDVYRRAKYRTEATPLFLAYSWVQLSLTVLLMYYMMVQIGDLSFSDLLWYAVFLSLGVFAYSTLMDGHRLAVPFEGIKLLLGLFLIYQMGGWFGMEAYAPYATVGMVAYLGLSFLSTIYFAYFAERSAPVGERTMRAEMERVG